LQIDKTLLIDALLDELNQNLATTILAANEARALATHEQSKPETQYDTVGLEASYLAHGQSQRVEEIKQSINSWKELAGREVNLARGVSLGSLVELEDEDGNTSYYLLGLHAGGMKLQQDGVLITVITNSSPLGKSLIGQQIYDEIYPPADPSSYLLISDIR